MKELEKKAKEFAQFFELTPREGEIFFNLVSDAGRFRNLGETLQLSPNTINNHLKKIFKKTKTHSKSELIGTFLNYALKKSDKEIPTKAPRILILDDEVEICEIIRQECEQRGIDCATCSNSENAINEIQEFYPDLVLSDVRMPGKNGADILKALRERSSSWPIVVFMSGHTDYLIEELLDYGAVDLLSKPLDFDLLFRKIFFYFVGEKSYQLNSERVPNTEVNFEYVEVGSGGVFAPFSQNPDLGEKLNIGHGLRFSFQLSTQTKIFATGEVVWKREAQREDLIPGVGVRFLNMDKRSEEEFCRYLNHERIHKFIPVGRKLESTFSTL